MSLFVDKLAEKQGVMSGEEFAAKLGIHPTIWSLVKSGRRQASRDVQQKALALFPDLSYWLVEDAKAAQVKRSDAKEDPAA